MKFWPKFWPNPRYRRTRGVSCSVCGALVADNYVDRSQHQLFHGYVWRLVAGDPNPVNEDVRRELRAWLESVDQGTA